ncbi:hypothetical protein [Alkalibaculum bacchi]|jgi:hypothetical protein|nr:hypothetical protein [Alkalibaculum bacchi]
MDDFYKDFTGALLILEPTKALQVKISKERRYSVDFRKRSTGFDNHA